jgi:hypothetical protein
MSVKLDTSQFLPYGDVYRSPHSGRRQYEVAQRGAILITEVGSGLHGVTEEKHDDRDEMGIAIEPPEVMLGLDDFALYEYRTKPLGVRSGPGDLDLNIYGLQKWIELGAAGNPTKLLPLFAPEDKLTRVRWPGYDLRERAHMFVSRSAGQRFLGYMQRQRARMIGSLNQRTNRPELIAEFGFDTKFAYHALRIGLQGTELMRTGRITLPMTADHREYLLAVRRGEQSKGMVLERLGRIEAELVRSIDETDLPEFPDHKAITAWLCHVYPAWWAAQA